jgi:hypothetical protein
LEGVERIKKVFFGLHHDLMAWHICNEYECHPEPCEIGKNTADACRDIEPENPSTGGKFSRQKFVRVMFANIVWVW